jgi:hypothetical protein
MIDNRLSTQSARTALHDRRVTMQPSSMAVNVPQGSESLDAATRPNNA